LISTSQGTFPSVESSPHYAVVVAKWASAHQVLRMRQNRSTWYCGVVQVQVPAVRSASRRRNGSKYSSRSPALALSTTREARRLRSVVCDGATARAALQGLRACCSAAAAAAGCSTNLPQRRQLAVLNRSECINSPFGCCCTLLQYSSFGWLLTTDPHFGEGHHSNGCIQIQTNDCIQYAFKEEMYPTKSQAYFIHTTIPLSFL
jgi:Tfp pilus assembly protein PilV